MSEGSITSIAPTVTSLIPRKRWFKKLVVRVVFFVLGEG
jgi:hypothetical protein